MYEVGFGVEEVLVVFDGFVYIKLDGKGALFSQL